MWARCGCWGRWEGGGEEGEEGGGEGGGATVCARGGWGGSWKTVVVAVMDGGDVHATAAEDGAVDEGCAEGGEVGGWGGWGDVGCSDELDVCV